MIELITLLLGLLIGPQPVELSASEEVAAVELWLDGKQVARLEGPRWATTVDLGPELTPHRLEARAFDAAGRPLERVRRLINVSSSNYAAAIALDPGRSGSQRTGRIVWQAVLDRQPAARKAQFDGQPLAIDAKGRFTLPAHDPRTRHAIEVTLEFKDGRSVHADLIFGGGFGDQVHSSLTAVPITSSRARAAGKTSEVEPWSAEDVEGWLERDGQPLAVFSTGTERGKLLLLRDEGVTDELGWLKRRMRGHGPERAEPSEQLNYSLTAISSQPVEGHPGTFKLVELGLVDPWRGLRPVLLSDRPLVARGTGKVKLHRRQKLWESLAVAGLNASASGGPRAVLLLLGVDPDDESLLTVSQAERYLSSVRVPLYVWTPLPNTLKRFGFGDTVRAASGVVGLEDTIRQIAVELATQTVVWVEGEHLPGEISLAATAPAEVELVR